MLTSLDKARMIDSSLYGFALGDGWGAITEFMTHKESLKLPRSIPDSLIITDDTQMGLYSMWAAFKILETTSLKNIETNVEKQNYVRRMFAEQYVRFYGDIDNDRAPGMTCMGALKKYINNPNVITGREGALGNRSKGCGTIMRTPWLGLLPVTREEAAMLALLQSQTTHDHPNAWVASVGMTVLVHDIFNGNFDYSYLEASSERNLLVWFEDFMDWDWHYARDSEYLAGAMSMTLNAKAKIDRWDEFMETDSLDDLCNIFGEGWTGDEALWCALAAATRWKHDPETGMEALVHTSGDSDSIASLGGSLLRMFNHDEGFNTDVKNRLELRYFKELGFLSDSLIVLNLI
jgi:ADP-ribosylglycohydrolase